MGLFSFVGKALKGISKVAGFIPGVGGAISKVTGTVGGLLDHKKPMTTSTAKMTSLGGRGTVAILRGKTGSYDAVAARNRAALGLPPLSVPTMQQASPVLPGGAVATAQGIPVSASPRGTVSSSYRTRRTTKKRKKATTRRKTTKRKKTRKLKFGSAAYRKKYLGHK